jgi:GNAT superfamily N-acetyltransferase
MKRISQDILNELVYNIKRIKFKNIIQDLKLEYCEDIDGDYIYLVLINIKKSQRRNGYGAAVLSEIIKAADNHGVRIRLWATNVYGSDLKQLYGFYRKHGFVFVDNDSEGHMVYYPDKTKN